MRLRHASLRHGLPVVLMASMTAPALAGRIQYAPGRVLMKPVAGVSDQQVEKMLSKVGGKAAARLNGLNIRVVEVPPGQEAKIANALSHRPDVAFAELDELLEPTAVVNDPNYDNQWHLPLMGAPAAWEIADGQGVTVAVCDSGVYAAHPDLAGQVINGWNTVSDSPDTADITGHGTRVAGVIAAAANNLIGGASVAPGSRILAMRITDRSDGGAYTSDMAECVAWAASHGARVANISYSGAGGSATVASAAADMMSLGGIVVVAAGNNGQEQTYDNSPYVVVAAGTDGGDNRASYSNYGSFIDIAAPGSDVFTTNSTGSYSSVNGTSYASPNTAATVALVMSANPALTPTDVTSILTNTSKDLGDAGWDKYYGWGRVDAGAAVALAATAQTSDRMAPRVAVTTPGAGATVNGVVAVDVQASDDFGVISVDLLVDGLVVATEAQEDPATPYVYRFGWDTTTNPVPDGAYQLTAQARDAAGNVGRSQEVSVTVANAVDTTPPVVTSLTPDSDATVSGSATLSAAATDDVEVASLVVSVNGFQCSGTDSVACTWDVADVPEGWYTVTATARDAAGHQAAESHSVYVKATTTLIATKAKGKGRVK